MRTGLSKGLYIRGLQCPKSLWLHKHAPELKDAVSEEQQAIFQSGSDVGELACELFPGGLLVPFEGLTVAEQIAKTARAMADGLEVIYEASFEHDGIFIKVDILRRGESGWEVYEVKGSTGVKDVHRDDVSLQLFVLKGAGIDVPKVCLVHIDNSYLRQGAVKVERLFVIADLTEMALERQEEVAAQVKVLRSMLTGATPEIAIGPQCSSPYGCDFQGHCWKDVPQDSVFDLAGRGIDKFKAYHDGLRSFEDLPLEGLNRSQRLQVEMHLAKGERIDREGIREFLDGLWYPLVHLDFETFISAIPLYDQTRPYQQVPFQYSIHIQREAGGSVEHFEYLAEPNVDPRPGLINGLLRTIPEEACVLAYFMAFEKSRLAELAEDFPIYSDRLIKLIGNVRDLIVPFRSRMAYRWSQHGSASIKKVLPAFVPELSYEGMAIANGGMAMQAYHTMCAEQNPQRLAELRGHLLDYCRLDTEAMVRLCEVLHKFVHGGVERERDDSISLRVGPS
jgi:hypothetical protein